MNQADALGLAKFVSACLKEKKERSTLAFRLCALRKEPPIDSHRQRASVSPKKERSMLAVRPRALRKEPPNGSHRQRASFLYPSYKDSIRGPPPRCRPPRA
eukprot:1146180-Pelagomonas_calceolata.AAC.2